MAIQKRTRLYEILVRINADGSWAAHQQNIEEIVENGTVISQSASGAMPLEPNAVASIVGAALPELSVEYERTKAELADVIAANTGLAAQVEALSAQVEALSAPTEA